MRPGHGRAPAHTGRPAALSGPPGSPATRSQAFGFMPTSRRRKAPGFVGIHPPPVFAWPGSHSAAPLIVPGKNGVPCILHLAGRPVGSCGLRFILHLAGRLMTPDARSQLVRAFVVSLGWQILIRGMIEVLTVVIVGPSRQ